MIDYTKEINTYLSAEIEAIRALDRQALNQALNALQAALARESTVYVFGNGGSAATASHFQNDFNKGVSEHTEKKYHFVCLNDNAAMMTAVANDIGYEEVFRFQLRGRLREGDIVLAISGSGNSPNVLRAAEYARELGNQVIGLTGLQGGRLKELADISLHVPAQSMQITEDVHLLFNHLMMWILRQAR